MKALTRLEDLYRQFCKERSGFSKQQLTSCALFKEHFKKWKFVTLLVAETGTLLSAELLELSTATKRLDV
jgi:hypothetical protein